MKSTGADAVDVDATEDDCDDEIECRRKPSTRERIELEDVEVEDNADAGRMNGSKEGLCPIPLRSENAEGDV